MEKDLHYRRASASPCPKDVHDLDHREKNPVPERYTGNGRKDTVVKTPVFSRVADVPNRLRLRFTPEK